jgi:hypothetical protein
MNGLQHLRQLHCESVRKKHPSLPDSAIASINYSDSNANGLTKCIVAYIGFIGGWGTRVSSAGRMLPVKVTEVTTQMKYIPGTTKKGTPDIMATYKGISLFIEVKIGKDRQSDVQKQVEAEVTASGGRYWIAKDFESTYNWINSL